MAISCRVWFRLNNSMTQSKWTIFKIRYSRNSKSSVWNTNFFTRQAIAKIHFVLQFTYTGDFPYGVWFNLNNFLTHWKDLFLKFPFQKIQKVPYEILTFFLGKLPQKLFLSYTLPTQGILHTEFGLVWSTPWPNKKAIFKVQYLKNSQISVWKPNFFLAKI